MLEASADYFRKQLNDVNKHYDSAENDIDIHVETMIQAIHKCRHFLIASIQTQRKKSVEKIELLRVATAEIETNNEKEEKEEDEKEETERMRKVYAECALVNQNCWYFVPSPKPFELKAVGFTVNNCIDRNFLKMKDLNDKLDDNEKIPLVPLAEISANVGVSLRQNIVPLSSRRTVSVDLTTNQNLNLHMFDSVTGELLKSIAPYQQQLASFPVSHGCNDKFVVCFAVKHGANDHNNQYNVLRTPTNRICLFDDELNLIKSYDQTWSTEFCVHHSGPHRAHPSESIEPDVLDHGPRVQRDADVRSACRSARRLLHAQDESSGDAER